MFALPRFTGVGLLLELFNDCDPGMNSMLWYVSIRGVSIYLSSFVCCHIVLSSHLDFLLKHCGPWCDYWHSVRHSDIQDCHCHHHHGYQGTCVLPSFGRPVLICVRARFLLDCSFLRLLLVRLLAVLWARSCRSSPSMLQSSSCCLFIRQSCLFSHSSNSDSSVVTTACPDVLSCVTPSLYSMVGATAALAGVSRMTGIVYDAFQLLIHAFECLVSVSQLRWS